MEEKVVEVVDHQLLDIFNYILLTTAQKMQTSFSNNQKIYQENIRRCRGKWREKKLMKRCISSCWTNWSAFFWPQNKSRMRRIERRRRGAMRNRRKRGEEEKKQKGEEQKEQTLGQKSRKLWAGGNREKEVDLGEGLLGLRRRRRRRWMKRSWCKGAAVGQIDHRRCEG